MKKLWRWIIALIVLIVILILLYTNSRLDFSPNAVKCECECIPDYIDTISSNIIEKTRVQTFYLSTIAQCKAFIGRYCVVKTIDGKEFEGHLNCLEPA